MRKIYTRGLFLLAFLIIQLSGFSQTVITVGNGSYVDQNLPIEPYYGYSYSQTIYHPTDIMMAGTITHLRYYFAGSSLSLSNNWKIYMGTTVKSSFETSTDWVPVSNLTQVYNGVFTSPTGPGWIEFDISDFYYGGNGYLVIAVEDDSPNYNGGSDDFYCTQSGFTGKSIFYYEDQNNVDPSNPPSGNLSIYYPNTQMVFQSLVPNDLGVIAFVSPLTYGSNTPNSQMPVTIKVKNFGTVGQDTFNLMYSMDQGTTVVNEIYNGYLAPGDTLTYSFTSKANMSSNGYYQGGAVVKNAGDTMNYNDTLFANFMVCNPLSGTYTIGDGVGYDFVNISSAANSLYNCGISGPVVFNIAPGVYNEVLYLGDIYGASTTNTITFQAAAGADSSTVTIYNDNTAAKLNNSKFVTLKNIGFKSYYDKTIHLMGNCSDISFKNCLFTGQSDYQYANNNLALIFYTSDNIYKSKNIVVEKCYLTGASYGVYYNGNGSNLDSNIVLKNNVIMNQSSSGLNINFVRDLRVEGNHIQNKYLASNYANYQGIYIYGAHGISKITQNTINTVGQCYAAAQLIAMNNAGQEDTANTLIANNVITSVSSGNNVNNFYISDSRNFQILHNSFSITGSNNAGTNLYLFNGMFFNVLNNIFSNKANGANMNWSYNYDFEIGHNAFYSNGNNKGIYNYSSYSDYDSLFNFVGDTTSFVANPSFYSEYDLHTNSIALNNKGIAVPEVTTDKDGNSRSLTTPDVGAYEFTPLANDLLITNLESSFQGNCNPSTAESIKVQIINQGTAAQSNFSISYKLDNNGLVSQTVLATILSGDTLDFTFSSLANFSAPGTHYISVYHSLAGDGNRFNDTIKFNFDIKSSINLPFYENYEDFSDINFHYENRSQSQIYINGQGGNYDYAALEMLGGSNTTWQYYGSDFYSLLAANQSHVATAYSCPILASSTQNLKLNFDIRFPNSYDSYNQYFWVTANDTIILKDMNGDSVFSSTYYGYETKSYNLSQFAGTNFTLQLNGLLNSNGSNYSSINSVQIDNLKIWEQKSNDVGVVQITSSSESECGNPNDSIFAIVENYGILPQHNIPVYFNSTVLGTNYSYNAILTDTIYPGERGVVYLGIFPTSFNGYFSIVSYTNLATEAERSNDTMRMSGMNEAYKEIPYVDNFDGSQNYWNTNSWWISEANWMGMSGKALLLESYGNQVETHGAAGYEEVYNNYDNYAIFRKAIGTINSKSVLKFNSRLNVSSGTFNDTIDIFYSTDCGNTVTKFYSLNQSNLSSYITTTVIPLGFLSGERVTFLFSARKQYNSNYVFALDDFGVVEGFDFSLNNDTTICSGDSVLLSTGLPVDSGYVFYWYSPGNTEFSLSPNKWVSQAGDYSVMVTNNNSGITKTDNFHLNVQPAIQYNITSNYYSVCALDPVNIAVNIYNSQPPYVLDWSAGNSSGTDTIYSTKFYNFYPTSTTTYHVNYIKDGLGCKLQREDSLTIQVFSPAQVSISGLESSYCSSDSIQILTGTPSGGVFTGPGIMANSFNPAMAASGSNFIFYNYTDNNGCKNADTAFTNVFQVPGVAITNQFASSYCSTEAPFVLTAYPSGGIFSGNGVVNNKFNPSTVNAGTTMLTYSYTSPQGCFNADTAYITVTAAPVVSITSNMPTDICQDGGSITLTGSPSGGVFTGPGVTGNSFNPATANIGLNTIIYSYTDTSGCSGYDTVTTNVHALPSVYFTTQVASAYCQNSTDVVLTAIPTGGTFTGSGVTGNIFQPSVASTGQNTITYTSVNAYGCVNSASTNTVIYPTPTVAITSSLATQYCQDGSSVTLAATPTGGTFTGVGVSGNTFNPSNANQGNVSIIYNYTDANNCKNSDTVFTTVRPMPNVVITTQVAPSYCQNNNLVNLTGYPTGGTFSGNGVISNTFNPSSATIGGSNIKYVFTNIYGCTSADSIATTVHGVPVVTMSTLPANICQDGNIVNLTAAPTGGIFTGVGVNGTTFNPNNANQGNVSVIYNYTDANNCSNSDTVTTMVRPLPSVNITSPIAASYCVDAMPVNLVATPSGGSFTGNGVAATIFTPSAATIGNANIVYTYTDMYSCSNTDTVKTVINSLPVVSLSTFADVCQSTSQVMLSGGSPSGGHYLGNGVNSTLGKFYPGVVDVGLNEIVYSFADANGCTSSDTQNIRVIGIPQNTFTVPSTICINDTATINYMGNASSTASFNWSFDNATIASGSNSGPYELIWTTSGVKALTLTVTDSSCVSTAGYGFTNVIPAFAIATVVGNSTVCFGDSVLIFANNNTGYSYQWFNANGIMPNDTLSFYSAIQSGSYYATVTNEYGCSANTSVVNATVHPLITSSFSLPATACINDIATVNYTGSAFGTPSYNWNFGSGIIATGSGAGPYGIIWDEDSIKTVSLKVISDGCSSTTTTKTINVINTPASITALGATTFCNGGNVTLYANAGNFNYSWKKNGISTGNTQPFFTATQSGFYTVEVTDPTTNCSNMSDTIEVVVNSTDFNLAFTASPTSFIIQPFTTTFTNQTPNASDYYWAWSFGDGGTSTLISPTYNYTFDGSYTVKAIAQNIATGCYDTIVKNNYISCTGAGANPCTLVASITPSGTATICPGDSVLLTAAQNANANYQWLKNGIMINGATQQTYWAKSNGAYQIMVTNSICSQFSTPVSVNLYSVITPSIISSGAIQPCSNDSMSLSVTTFFNSYLWSNGATAQTTYVNTSGEYYVTVTDVNGCKTKSAGYQVNASLLQTPEICIVGVDSIANSNFIVWQKQNDPLISGYNVYRESTVAGVYNMIGSTNINDPGVFHDQNSNPMTHAYRYRITAVDTCGTETPPSPIHKTIHLTINAGLNNTWNLIWDGYTGFNFGSYRIYRGGDSTQLTMLTQIQSTLNSYTDLNPPAGKVYYQIEVVAPHTCYPDSFFNKAQTNYNTSRSNHVNTSMAGGAGINEKMVTDFAASVYPNPTDGLFELELVSAKQGDFQVSVVNVLGETIYSIEDIHVAGKTNQTIDLRKFARGVYNVVIQNGNDRIVKKIVLN